MRLLAICGIVLGAGACLAQGANTNPVRASSQVTSSDSVAIVRVAWQTVTAGHASRRALRLWSPLATDTVGLVPLSRAITNALTREGIPVVARRLAGDDTVVFHIARWQSDPDSARVVLEIRSAWTTVLGAGARACRTGSANIEQLRVTRRDAEWRSDPRGPVMHGDNACVPLQRRASGSAPPA
jgi:hypothetical protein